jgi:hypothetical protein
MARGTNGRDRAGDADTSRKRRSSLERFFAVLDRQGHFFRLDDPTREEG